MCGQHRDNAPIMEYCTKRIPFSTVRAPFAGTAPYVKSNTGSALHKSTKRYLHRHHALFHSCLAEYRRDCLSCPRWLSVSASLARHEKGIQLTMSMGGIKSVLSRTTTALTAERVLHSVLVTGLQLHVRSDVSASAPPQAAIRLPKQHADVDANAVAQDTKHFCQRDDKHTSSSTYVHTSMRETPRQRFKSS